MRAVKRLWFLAMGLGILLGSTFPAHAQTVDYGSLQSLFGEPVTTSATGKPQKESEVPVGMDIITSDQIRRMGATSLPEVLNHVNGVTTFQDTRSFADVGIRGQNTFYNPTLLVLVNGRQVYIDTYGFTDWSLIPVELEEIRQIEVVKGPATALYGFNAVDGVVNIVTYNPKYDKVGQMGATVGTGNYRREYGFKTFDLSDKASLRLSAGQEDFHEYEDTSKTGFANASSYRTPSTRKAMADSLFQLDDKTQLRVEASYAGAVDNDSPTTPEAVPTDKSFISGKASLTSETQVGLLEGNVYINAYTNKEAGAFTSTQQNQIVVAQLQDLFKIGADHTVRLQAEYRHNQVESDVLNSPNATVSDDVASLGAMWNWTINPQWEWTNALRVDELMLNRSGPFQTTVPFTSNDQFDRNLAALSGNTGLVWKVTDMDTLRASYGRGVQAPSLHAFGLDFPLYGGSVIVAGDPALNPTIVNNYEMGYDRLVNAINGKFGASVFYKKTDKVLAVSGVSYTSGGTTISQVAPIGNTETVGTELSLKGKIASDWDWDVGYTYQNTVDDFNAAASATPSSVSLHYQDTVPHHVVKAHVGYTTGPWEADAYGEVASNFSAVSLDGSNYSLIKLDNYEILSGRVGYKLNDLTTVALQGTSLLTSSVANGPGLETQREVYLSLTRKF